MRIVHLITICVRSAIVLKIARFPSSSTTTQWYVLKLAALMLLGVFYTPKTPLGQYTYPGPLR